MNFSQLAMVKSLLLGAILISTLVAGIDTAHANLSFDPGNTFSGAAPAGYVTAQFTDTAGGVQLVITSNLASGENLDAGKALYFNLNPDKSALLNNNNLSFALMGNTNFNQQAAVSTGVNQFKADGDGYYDIQFSFTSSTKAFATGETQTYMITSNNGTICANDFTKYLSYEGGGNGIWLAAIHVQNTPAGGSGSSWVGATPTPVPVPAAVWFLGSGLAGLAGVRMRSGKRVSEQSSLTRI